MTTSTPLPPPTVARLVERARHYLLQVHQRTVPPYAAMMEMLMNAWSAQAITAAVDLGIAEALADGPLGAEELAARVNADADALHRLLRVLVGRGIFRQRRDGRYQLNSLADTLRRSAPKSVAGLASLYGSREHREHWSHLAEAIRTGKAVIPALHGAEAFEYLNSQPELAKVFNRAMAETTEMTVPFLLAAYSFGITVAFVAIGIAFTRAMAAFRWVRDHYDWIRYLSGGTLVVLGLLLFFNRDWWLRVLLNRALDALGLGGQL